jgi:hypothetical protein
VNYTASVQSLTSMKCFRWVEGSRIPHCHMRISIKSSCLQTSLDRIYSKGNQRLLRVGHRYLFALLRQEYWISRGRQVQQSTLDKNSLCFKQWAVACQQLMGQLLTPWVQLERPFLNYGVDYAWPFYVKQGSPRSKIQVKCYVSILICSCQGSSS